MKLDITRPKVVSINDGGDVTVHADGRLQCG